MDQTLCIEGGWNRSEGSDEVMRKVEVTAVLMVFAAVCAVVVVIVAGLGGES